MSLFKVIECWQFRKSFRSLVLFVLQIFDQNSVRIFLLDPLGTLSLQFTPCKIYTAFISIRVTDGEVDDHVLFTQCSSY